ncbi:hypothetical protein [Neisseria animalis]|uniref:Uncharacterized protein n=1 Tax=Neisseria animalis TaxID=492 RepID=A0A5P3MPU4_NEIAN|nr:hypothetical protein [Neisseria animalis]QEY23587.1 hypothetical protein D0T90_02960 [Neisseria animalis]ROW32732.1 hypothetical protein CGZ60_02580 [Neisseria animalis]VEE09280.1 membrane protein [Neisseria animalis]
MVADWNVWSAAVYGLIWLLLIFRAGMFQWFWGSVLLWLGVSVLGSRLLLGIWGMTHIGPLMLPHFYLTVASVFFWIDFRQATAEDAAVKPDRRFEWLALFALSNMVMTAAFVLTLGLMWYHYPNGLTLAVLPAMLQFYALQPLDWFVLQAVLMAVFYVHRRLIERRPAYCFSLRQWYAGCLLAFVLQWGCIIGIALDGRM